MAKKKRRARRKSYSSLGGANKDIMNLSKMGITAATGLGMAGIISGMVKN